MGNFRERVDVSERKKTVIVAGFLSMSQGKVREDFRNEPHTGQGLERGHILDIAAPATGPLQE